MGQCKNSSQESLPASQPGELLAGEPPLYLCVFADTAPDILCRKAAAQSGRQGSVQLGERWELKARGPFPVPGTAMLHFKSVC